MRRYFLLCSAMVLLLLVPLRGGQQTGDAIPLTGDADAALVPFDDLMVSFLQEHDVPGAALAIGKDGKLIYARGFGYADPEGKEKVLPTSLFRIASISKPITAAAILLLVERGKLKLDDKAFDVLVLSTPPGRRRDPRLRDVTIRHLLQHTGGWDRAKSFDPMFRPILIAKELEVQPPAGPDEVIRYMLGQPLDFDPGSRYAYSNFGYCVLGRIIETVSGRPYETFVRDEVFKPLGITQTRLGKTLQRAPGEVKYHGSMKGPAVIGPEIGKVVPAPYGAWYLEAMDSHGGWISTAADLVRFASAFDRPDKSPLLKHANWEAMFARPEGRAGFDEQGKPLPAYYALGWQVRPKGGGFDAFHAGALDGTGTLLVRRHDGLAWAVLFNTRTNAKLQSLTMLIDPLLHQAAAKVKHWPMRSLNGGCTLPRGAARAGQRPCG
jgi:N-acyl-D-amino-acid deacylase